MCQSPHSTSRGEQRAAAGAGKAVGTVLETVLRDVRAAASAAGKTGQDTVDHVGGHRGAPRPRMVDGLDEGREGTGSEDGRRRMC